MTPQGVIHGNGYHLQQGWTFSVPDPSIISIFIPGQNGKMADISKEFSASYVSNCYAFHASVHWRVAIFTTDAFLR
jgi:hypothetical protein